MKNNQKRDWSLGGRKVKENRAGRSNERLQGLGKHVVKLLGFRTTNKNGEGSRWWWADFEVVSGPTPAGTQVSQGYCPEEAKYGGRMSYVQAKALEEGKVVKMVGSFYGYDAKTADQQIGDDEIAHALDQPDIGASSPLVDRLLVIDHVPWVSKNKNEQGEFKKGTNYNFYPYLENGVSPYSGLGATEEGSSEPTFEDLLEKHGFAVHPSDSNWVYNTKTDDPAINVDTFLETYR